ncbi:unnamed protein product [Sphagnum tenellum]
MRRRFQRTTRSQPYQLLRCQQESFEGGSSCRHNPVATGEQISAILRETFDVNQPQPLPSTTLQMEVHPLPVPKPVPLFQDPLPSADFAVGSRSSKTLAWHFASDAAPVPSTHSSSTSGGQQPAHSATGAGMPETSLSMRSFVTSLDHKP